MVEYRKQNQLDGPESTGVFKLYISLISRKYLKELFIYGLLKMNFPFTNCLYYFQYFYIE